MSPMQVVAAQALVCHLLLFQVQWQEAGSEAQGPGLASAPQYQKPASQEVARPAMPQHWHFKKTVSAKYAEPFKMKEISNCRVNNLHFYNYCKCYQLMIEEYDLCDFYLYRI